MSQVFHPSANTVAKASLFGVLALLAGALLVSYSYVRSAWATDVDVPVQQPVQFSHEHHVAGLGVDCRYCHTTVETSASANIPPTYTCMSCHSQIWNTSPALQPVRDSLANNTSIEWNRVYNLPDYVYFNHSIHVAKGVGCETCHGRVDQMPLMRKAVSLQMKWCLDCHRAPEQYIRPREHVFDMGYTPAEDQATLGRRLLREYNIQSVALLTSCSTCHH
ncbi:cytochrome c3 family protein [Kouleothrix sp.]|uniref:cytochrome c3 family protein n=1 Tax=Kouleothrix sp. TaxID=2779161 RepID=UPI003918777B